MGRSGAVIEHDEFDESLMEAAKAAMLQAHAPYSGFAVGAAVRLNNGTVIIGANFENASLGLSLCAETVALATANSAGQLRDIVAIAVVGGPMTEVTQNDGALLTPCGRCRQILAEAAQLAGRDIPVYCADVSGERRATFTVSQLLPHAFSAATFARGQNI